MILGGEADQAVSASRVDRRPEMPFAPSRDLVVADAYDDEDIEIRIALRRRGSG